MLFILSGDIQTGKTRWLTALIQQLAEQGVESYGVLAPGVWREHEQGENDASIQFEKLGIDNMLLPEQEVVSFARRRDLAVEEGLYDEKSQSAQAQLGWEISESALAQVNHHFCSICPKKRPKKESEAVSGARHGADLDDRPAPDRPGLLVIDELGPLEILHRKGLKNAVHVAGLGPSDLYAHALIIVRESLAEQAIDLFGEAWGGARIVTPTEETRSQIFAAFAL